MSIVVTKNNLISRFLKAEEEKGEKYYVQDNMMLSKEFGVVLPSKLARYVGYHLITDKVYTRLEATIIAEDGIEYTFVFDEKANWGLVPVNELEDVEDDSDILSIEQLIKKELDFDSFVEFEEIVNVSKLLTFSKSDEEWDTTKNIEKFFTDEKKKQLELGKAFREALIVRGKDVKEVIEQLTDLTKNLL